MVLGNYEIGWNSIFFLLKVLKVKVLKSSKSWNNVCKRHLMSRIIKYINLNMDASHFPSSLGALTHVLLSTMALLSLTPAHHSYTPHLGSFFSTIRSYLKQNLLTNAIADVFDESQFSLDVFVRICQTSAWRDLQNYNYFNLCHYWLMLDSLLNKAVFPLVSHDRCPHFFRFQFSCHFSKRPSRSS